MNFILIINALCFIIKIWGKTFPLTRFVAEIPSCEMNQKNLILFQEDSTHIQFLECNSLAGGMVTVLTVLRMLPSVLYARTWMLYTE